MNRISVADQGFSVDNLREKYISGNVFQTKYYQLARKYQKARRDFSNRAKFVTVMW